MLYNVVFSTIVSMITSINMHTNIRTHAHAYTLTGNELSYISYADVRVYGWINFPIFINTIKFFVIK